MAIYVVSDLHGRKDKYDAIMEYLKEDDFLYILGDVIDRGCDGIKILLDIMERKNVLFLLGNHEQMMTDYLDWMEGELCKSKTSANAWLFNGAMPTLEAYEDLYPQQKKSLREFLKNSPYIVYDLTVNGRTFNLCHAKAETVARKHIMYESDITNYERLPIVWDRVYYKEECYNGNINIIGHTPTMRYQNNTPYEIYRGLNEEGTEGFIDIDCGLAANNEHCRAALFCLDNMDVIYF